MAVIWPVLTNTLWSSCNSWPERSHARRLYEQNIFLKGERKSPCAGVGVVDKLHRNRLSWHEDSTILLTKVWEDFRRFIPFSTTWDLLINPKRKFLIFKRVQHRLSIPYFTTVFGSIMPHLKCLCQSHLVIVAVLHAKSLTFDNSSVFHPTFRCQFYNYSMSHLSKWASSLSCLSIFIMHLTTKIFIIPNPAYILPLFLHPSKKKVLDPHLL